MSEPRRTRAQQIEDERLGVSPPASQPDSDLAHNTRRMLQALDAYWMWCDGWNGPRYRCPGAEEWWTRFEKYRARVEAGRAALVLFRPANKEQS